MALWKWYIDFQFLLKRCWRQQIMETCELIAIFLKSSHRAVSLYQILRFWQILIQRYKPWLKMTPSPWPTRTLNSSCSTGLSKTVKIGKRNMLMASNSHGYLVFLTSSLLQLLNSLTLVSNFTKTLI